MKHYQPRKQNPYILPHHIYYKTIWEIKGYYWLKERVEDIILATPDHDGQPHAGGVSDPTYTKALKLGDSASRLRIIEEERDRILPEYRQGVWDNIMHGSRYPDDADRRTYSRHKSKFVYRVAVRLGYYSDQ